MDLIMGMQGARTEEAWTSLLKLVLTTSILISDDTPEIIDDWAEHYYGTPSSSPHPGFGTEIKRIALEIVDSWDSKVDLAEMGFEVNPEWIRANPNRWQLRQHSRQIIQQGPQASQEGVNGNEHTKNKRKKKNSKKNKKGGTTFK